MMMVMMMMMMVMKQAKEQQRESSTSAPLQYCPFYGELEAIFTHQDEDEGDKWEMARKHVEPVQRDLNESRKNSAVAREASKATTDSSRKRARAESGGNKDPGGHQHRRPAKGTKPGVNRTLFSGLARVL
jgi:hypothetical protein